jgi:hypothetical protein
MARNPLAGRLARELKTIDAMIGIYCRDVHRATPESCAECGRLGAYARERLVKCPFGPDKPTCLNCTVHCYLGEMRARVRVVMRHAGPRLLLRYPILTLIHLYWDSRRRAPERAGGMNCPRISAPAPNRPG